MSRISRANPVAGQADGDARYVGATLPGGFVSGSPGTRRAQFAFGGAGDTNNSIGGLTDAQQRLPVLLPVSTTRWRLRIRNAHSDGVGIAGAFAFNGIWFGHAQLSGADGFPNGAFTAAPTQAVTSFSTDSAGAADTVTPWVTDSALQFTAGQVELLSMGWTTAATTIARGCGAVFYEAGTGASGHAGNAATPGSKAANVQLDIRLEYEFVGSNRIGIALGDSLTEAFYADSPILYNYGVWHQRFAQRNRTPMCASACYGFQTNQFGSTSAWNWTRWANSGLTIDFAVIQLGTNDANGSAALSTFQSRVGTLVANLRAIGINDIFWNTIAPRTAGDWTTAKENLRASYNTWLRQMPFNLRGVPEVARALADPTVATASPQLLHPDYASSDTTHWTPAAHHRAGEVLGGAVLLG